MAEKKPNSERELRFISTDFKCWNKEKEEEEPSNIIDSVYINKIKFEDKEFFDISIKTKDNRTHKSTLNTPMSDEQKKINKKLREMSSEKRKEVLEMLENK